jgi:hypothetical protein
VTGLAAGLSGMYGVAIDGAGHALVTGGFTQDFSSSTVVAIDLAAPHASTERAHGFAFSSDLFQDTTRDETLVLDFGVSAITAICADRDGDSLCDVDDACTLPVALDRVKLGFGKKFVLKAALNVPTAPVLDPIATGARIRVDGARGMVLDVTVPGGAFDRALDAGWKFKKGKYSWKGDAHGITSVKIKTDATRPGALQLAVAGTGWVVAAEDLPLRATAGVSSVTGQCGEIAFAAEACAYNAKRHVAQCK